MWGHKKLFVEDFISQHSAIYALWVQILRRCGSGAKYKNSREPKRIITLSLFLTKNTTAKVKLVFRQWSQLTKPKIVYKINTANKRNKLHNICNSNQADKNFLKE